LGETILTDLRELKSQWGKKKKKKKEEKPVGAVKV
jgi:hypothetical protein